MSTIHKHSFPLSHPTYIFLHFLLILLHRVGYMGTDCCLPSLTFLFQSMTCPKDFLRPMCTFQGKKFKFIILSFNFCPLILLLFTITLILLSFNDLPTTFLATHVYIPVSELYSHFLIYHYYFNFCPYAFTFYFYSCIISLYYLPTTFLATQVYIPVSEGETERISWT